MRHRWFTNSLSAALVLGIVWAQTDTAYAVSFTPPGDNTAPRGTAGGASRGSFFTPPEDNAAPRRTTGGASRGSFFTPPSDSAAPRGSTGGASRDTFFTPPGDNAAPRGATGGASRDTFFTPPSDSAAPRGATGGASRDISNSSSESSNELIEATKVSIAGATSMLAVMPDSFFGKTVEARPTIMVYVPASNASEAVFSLKDETKGSVYEMPVSVPASGGIVAVKLPSDAPELVVNQNYQWYLALKVDGAIKPASPFVDGWVKRVEPTREMAALAGESAIAEIEVLGSNGIWYDTAAKLAALRAAQGDEAISQHWYELLESVGLAQLAVAPVFIGP